MRRFLFALVGFWALLVLSGTIPRSSAQAAVPRPTLGDPPVASLITFSPPDAEGRITITGLAGAVVPNGSVIIRNLYTEATATAPVGVTGAFTVRIFGEGNTPFWISRVDTAQTPEASRAPGSVLGGAGTIVWADFPREIGTGDVTRLAVDGDLSDWETLDASRMNTTVNALRSRDALWIAVRDPQIAAIESSGEAASARVVFIADTITFAVNASLRDPGLSALERLNPNQSSLDSLKVSAFPGAGTAEIRIPLTFLDMINSFSLVEVSLLNGAGEELVVYPASAEVPFEDLHDGVFRPNGSTIQNGDVFTVGGVLGEGAAFWTAWGRTSSLALEAGESLNVELDVTFHDVSLPSDLYLWAAVSLQPIIEEGENGWEYPGDVGTNNGWSGTFFNGLPVDNLDRDEIALIVPVAPHQLIFHENTVEFSLDFVLTLPESVEEGYRRGLYVPRLEGIVAQNDIDPTQLMMDESAHWERSPLFGTGAGVSRQPITRLPLVINVGGVENVPLPTALLYDTPSDGSRGIMADENQADYALSNRVIYNAPTYILPPFRDGTDTALTYILEPYLMSLLPNAYDSNAAPLIPFDFSGANANASVLRVEITKPDGTTVDLGELPILQAALSTAALNERTQFGAQSPVDMYRLTTYDPALIRFSFDQYGDYVIDSQFTIRDVWGNSYQGGGTYHLLIGEQFEIVPAVLPGTPMQVGDVFHSGVTLMPGAPADVTVNLTVYPITGGDPITQTFTGEANRYGVFAPDSDEAFTFAVPGMYVVDYEARYTDPAGRIWAASLRSVGLIESPDSVLIARGQRGLLGVDDPRLTWFRADGYRGEEVSPVTPYFPYFSGDVVWIGETAESGIAPAIRVQDIEGVYADQVIDALIANPQARIEYEMMTGLDAPEAAALDELPVYGDAGGYSFVSAVRPGLSLRAFLRAGGFSGLPLWWDSDDVYNRQIGAGTTGDRPGDFAFLFGGALIRSENVESVSIYGALSVVIDDNDSRGERLYPPLNGAAGAGDGGALITIDDREFNMFFVPSGTPPGALLRVGEPITIAGQVAPTIAAGVNVTITAPSGAVMRYSGRANAIGYFYDPEHDLITDEIGVWTVDIEVVGDAVTSVGQSQPPYPTGSVLRADGTQYQVYVLPEESETLQSTVQRADVLIPTGVAYNFGFTIPQEWQSPRAYVTLRTPSYILTDSTVRINGRSFGYQFAPANIRGSFPNIENEPRGSGSAVVDPMTLTVVIVGTDSAGALQMQSRQYTLFYNRLMQLTDGSYGG